MAVAFALLTALCYGVSNFVGPRLAGGAPLYVVLLAGQVVALLASGVGLLVSGDAVGARPALFALLAGVANAGGLVTLYRAATFGPLSIVVPIGALGASVPVVAGLVSGEPLGVARAAGIVLALGGVVVAARPSGREPAEQDTQRAVRWALVSALSFGVFLAAISPASEDGVFGAVFLSRAALVPVLVLIALRLHEPLRAPASVVPKLALPGVLLFAGTLSYAAATREGDLSVVSVIGSLFPVVTVALAFAIGQERLSRAQGAGVAAALAGVVLLSL